MRMRNTRHREASAWDLQVILGTMMNSRNWWTVMDARLTASDRFRPSRCNLAVERQWLFHKARR